MGFWKLSPFLALGFLVLYQVGIFQAAPISSALESPEHHASLNKEEADLLLPALIKNHMKRMASEQEQETENAGSKVQKRACGLATCMTDRLASLLAQQGSTMKDKFNFTNLGIPPPPGRRRRDVQE